MTGQVKRIKYTQRYGLKKEDRSKERQKEYQGRNDKGRGLGGMWRRQSGKQLTQHTKMHQALTDANPAKQQTNQHKRH